MVEEPLPVFVPAKRRFIAATQLIFRDREGREDGRIAGQLWIAGQVFLEARRFAAFQAKFQFDVNEFDESGRRRRAAGRKVLQVRPLTAVERGLKGFDATLDLFRARRRRVNGC
jgi:hypothetical protein